MYTAVFPVAETRGLLWVLYLIAKIVFPLIIMAFVFKTKGKIIGGKQNGQSVNSCCSL